MFRLKKKKCIILIILCNVKSKLRGDVNHNTLVDHVTVFREYKVKFKKHRRSQVVRYNL